MPSRRAEPPKAKKGRPQPAVTTKTAPPRHGGPRPGAGRPPRGGDSAPAGPIPWKDVERYATSGAPEAEIATALGITEAVLQDRVVADRFRAAIVRGHAQFKVGLREQIKLRGNKTNKGAGSVNALALQARNHLDWDREVPQQLAAPDLAGARERLRDTLIRLAAARSEVEATVISPLEIIYREAFGRGAEASRADLKEP